MYLQVILQVYFICSLKLLMYTTVLRVRAHYNFKDNYFNYIGVSTKVKLWDLISQNEMVQLGFSFYL